MELIKDFIDLQKALARSLFSLKNFGESPGVTSPRLIFPDKGDVIRFSEQEARVQLCNILNSSWYYYSVETPTKETYKFKGQSYSKASTD